MSWSLLWIGGHVKSRLKDRKVGRRGTRELPSRRQRRWMSPIESRNGTRCMIRQLTLERWLGWIRRWDMIRKLRLDIARKAPRGWRYRNRSTGVLSWMGWHSGKGRGWSRPVIGRSSIGSRWDRSYVGGRWDRSHVGGRLDRSRQRMIIEIRMRGKGVGRNRRRRRRRHRRWLSILRLAR